MCLCNCFPQVPLFVYSSGCLSVCLSVCRLPTGRHPRQPQICGSEQQQQQQQQQPLHVSISPLLHQSRSRLVLNLKRICGNLWTSHLTSIPAAKQSNNKRMVDHIFPFTQYRDSIGLQHCVVIITSDERRPIDAFELYFTTTATSAF